MILRYYKSATDDGGAIGDEIASGSLNALFDKLASIDLVTGVEKLRKLWIESDTAGDLYNFLGDEGLYAAALFESANPDTDTVGDLTGSERKYSPALITGATITTITVNYDPAMESYAVDDLINIDGLYNIIDGFVDNLDDTATITIRTELANPSSFVSKKATVIFNDAYLVETPKAFWIKLKVPPGSAYSGDDYIKLTTLS